MNRKTEQFIKENIDLIDNNNFDSLYSKIEKPDSTVTAEDITQILIKANIDPLKYMTYVPGYYFYHSIDLIDLIIPEGIKEIKEYAFSYCSNLKSISFPKSLIKLGRYAFLSDITLPEIDLTDVKEIGIGCFFSCDKLKKVILPKELSNSSFDCFEYIHKPKTLILNSDISDIRLTKLGFTNTEIKNAIHK